MVLWRKEETLLTRRLNIVIDALRDERDAWEDTKDNATSKYIVRFAAQRIKVINSVLLSIR